MPGITLAQAQAQLDAWLAASLKTAANQSYEIAGRKLTRADAAEIKSSIEFWNAEVIRLTNEAMTGSGFGFYRGIVG